MNSQLLSLCQAYGPLLKLPDDIDGRKLMWAIAGNESSFGGNTTPRYEASYDLGGQNCRNEQIQLVARLPKDGHGRSLAAFSYGPWQMLLCNARGFGLREMQASWDSAAQAFVGFVNRYIVMGHKASNFDEICQCYNSGHFQLNPEPGVQRYVADALHNYQTAEFS